MLTGVHQFLPTFAARDAIGAHVLHVRTLLRRAGFASEIFADDVHAEVAGEARHYREFPTAATKAAGGRTWVLYHASTGSPMVEFLLGRDDPLLVYYHNITEAGFFDRWAPLAAQNMRAARDQLRRLAPATALAMANSSFSEADLVAAGFTRTAVVPVLVDLAGHRLRPHARTLARLRQARARGGAHWLFVGRVAPNKCQHDVVAAFAAYRRLYDPQARLSLVGGRTADLYWKAVEAMVAELDLGGAVTLTDTIPPPALRAYYRSADVFVCLSEHEGFCVPVLEAMHFGVPVVAYASSALPETIADAGLVLADKDPVLVAAAVHRVLTDDALRRSLQAAGSGRVEHFSLANSGRRLLDTLGGFLAEGEDDGAVPA